MAETEKKYSSAYGKLRRLTSTIDCQTRQISVSRLIHKMLIKGKKKRRRKKRRKEKKEKNISERYERFLQNYTFAQICLLLLPIGAVFPRETNIFLPLLPCSHFKLCSFVHSFLFLFKKKIKALLSHHVYVCTCIYICIYMCVCVYIYMCARVCICVCICLLPTEKIITIETTRCNYDLIENFPTIYRTHKCSSFFLLSNINIPNI